MRDEEDLAILLAAYSWPQLGSGARGSLASCSWLCLGDGHTESTSPTTSLPYPVGNVQGSTLSVMGLSLAAATARDFVGRETSQ